MGKPVELHQAFVLHRRPFRESSQLVELFSADYGRISAVARGAQRPKSRLRPALQMYQPLLVSWSGRGDLVTLTSAEADGPQLISSGESLLHGFYINELIMRLIHRHESLPGVYQLYHQVLHELQANKDPESSMRRFEKRLLEELGYGLILEHDTAGTAIEPEALYLYEIESGPVMIEGKVEKATTIRGKTLLAMAADALNGADQLAEAKRILRGVIAHYLDYKPLETRKLYASYLRQMSGA